VNSHSVSWPEEAMWERFRAADHARGVMGISHEKQLSGEFCERRALIRAGRCRFDRLDGPGEIKRLQAEWKTIGPVEEPLGMIGSLPDRVRSDLQPLREPGSRAANASRRGRSRRSSGR
jgi:hypothetical protein